MASLYSCFSMALAESMTCCSQDGVVEMTGSAQVSVSRGLSNQSLCSPWACPFLGFAAD